MLPEKLVQLWVGRHYAAVSLSPVLELARFARASVVGPLAARIRRRAANVQLAPVVIVWRSLPLLALLVPASGRQDHVVPAEVDGFLGPKPGVVHHREEGNQPRA